MGFALKGDSKFNPTNIAHRNGRGIFQNAQILVLECLLCVALFLIENVFPDRLEMRWAYTEKSVTICQ